MSNLGGRPKGLPKTGGRKAGTPNKVTSTQKVEIAELVQDNVPKLREMLSKIVEPKEFVMAWCRIAEYALPKKAAVSVDAEVKKSDLASELAEMAEKEI